MTKTEVTITIRLDRDAFDETKKREAGALRELIEEALSEMFATNVEVVKWSAVYKKEK